MVIFFLLLIMIKKRLSLYKPCDCILHYNIIYILKSKSRFSKIQLKNILLHYFKLELFFYRFFIVKTLSEAKVKTVS